MNEGIRDLPGFVPSLRLLIERERYSLRDIALMFGVSGERIRQVCEREQIANPNGHRTGLKCIRLWDDTQNRFLPVGRLEIKKRHSRARSFAQKARISRRRSEIVATVAALATRLGRNPSWKEIYCAVTCSDGEGVSKSAFAPIVLGMYDWRLGKGRARDVLRRFRRETGTRRRSAAEWRPRSTVCGVCGAMKRTLPSGQQWCPKQATHRALRSPIPHEGAPS